MDRMTSWTQALRDNFLREPKCHEEKSWVSGFCTAYYRRPLISFFSTATSKPKNFTEPLIDALTIHHLHLQVNLSLFLLCSFLLIVRCYSTSHLCSFSHLVVQLNFIDFTLFSIISSKELRNVLSEVAQYSPDKSTVILVPVTIAHQNLAIDTWCNFKNLGIRNVFFWALSFELKEILQQWKIPFYFNSKFSSTQYGHRDLHFTFHFQFTTTSF
jgi:hypothetical protein